MPALLAPYNDSMRLGMGFNSYSQTMCMSGAVDTDGAATMQSWDKNVTYSSRFVERLSDITDLIGISHGAAIKKRNIQMCVFMSLISFRCTDPTKRDSTIGSLKEIITSRCDNDGSFDDMRWLTDHRISSLEDVETTISASWRSRDKVQTCKGSKARWNLDSVHNAAVRFPNLLEIRTEKVWAILSKYKEKRSFNEWAMLHSFPTLEYDLSSLTAELFDNFMENKRLGQKVQDMISHRDHYSQIDKPKAIPVQLNTLLAVRTALKNEMNKIVAIVDLLCKEPSLLHEVNVFDNTSHDELVRTIVDGATNMSPRSSTLLEPHPIHGSDEQIRSATHFSSGDSTTNFPEILTPRSHDFESGNFPVMPNRNQASPDLKTRLASLIAPEVWADLLPAKANPAPATSEKNSLSTFSSKESRKLTVLAAVCGIHDVTSSLQQRVKHQTLIIPINKIDTLEDDVSYGDFEPRPRKNLSFIYQYGDGPIRICSLNHDESSDKVINITDESNYPEVSLYPNHNKSWFIITVVYGGRIYNRPEELKKIVGRAEYRDKVTRPLVSFDPHIIENGFWGKPDMAGVVFYRFSASPNIRAAVSIGPSGCLLADQPQLACFTREITKEVEVEVIKEVQVVKEVPRIVNPNNKITFGVCVSTPRQSCTFDCGRLEVVPRDNEPFLKFPNGVKFVYRVDGNLAVLDAKGKFLFKGQTCYLRDIGGYLRFNDEGLLYTITNKGRVSWNPFLDRSNAGGRLILSSAKPYIEIYTRESKKIWDSCGFDA
ncbi:hypothetical protein F53441_9682 [Fusarium austroafricanum]|uniref:Bulb-type lectin domain-containing protein n=1 Tax=Fusarium austroafricanum TaxID=2364996 RepID=A0A8H4NVB1_9HYPO|nr:hypothetical protein F53441_9682 [Fusarium austroafricanum]